MILPLAPCRTAFLALIFCASNVFAESENLKKSPVYEAEQVETLGDKAWYNIKSLVSPNAWRSWVASFCFEFVPEYVKEEAPIKEKGNDPRENTLAAVVALRHAYGLGNVTSETELFDVESYTFAFNSWTVGITTHSAKLARILEAAYAENQNLFCMAFVNQWVEALFWHINICFKDDMYRSSLWAARAAWIVEELEVAGTEDAISVVLDAWEEHNDNTIECYYHESIIRQYTSISYYFPDAIKHFLQRHKTQNRNLFVSDRVKILECLLGHEELRLSKELCLYVLGEELPTDERQELVDFVYSQIKWDLGASKNDLVNCYRRLDLPVRTGYGLLNNFLHHMRPRASEEIVKDIGIKGATGESDFEEDATEEGDIAEDATEEDTLANSPITGSNSVASNKTIHTRFIFNGIRLFGKFIPMKATKAIGMFLLILIVALFILLILMIYQRRHA